MSLDIAECPLGSQICLHGEPLSHTMTPVSTYSPGTTLFNFQDSKRDGESKTVLRGNVKVPGLLLVYSGVHFIITLVFYAYISLCSPFNKNVTWLYGG